MSFKKIPNGDYYYFTKYGGTEFMIKYKDGNKKHKTGTIEVHTTCPGELVGKKVRLKLEVVKR